MRAFSVSIFWSLVCPQASLVHSSGSYRTSKATIMPRYRLWRREGGEKSRGSISTVLILRCFLRIERTKHNKEAYKWTLHSTFQMVSHNRTKRNPWKMCELTANTIPCWVVTVFPTGTCWWPLSTWTSVEKTSKQLWFWNHMDVYTNAVQVACAHYTLPSIHMWSPQL